MAKETHAFVYGILFPKKDLEIGLFNVQIDIFEGNTEENAVAMLAIICDKMGFDIAEVKAYVFKKVSDIYLKELVNAKGFLRGPGNDGSGQSAESVSGTGDSGVPPG